MADDFTREDGISSNNPIFKDLVNELPLEEAEKLWWLSLDAVITSTSKNQTEQSLKDWLILFKTKGSSAVSISEISARMLDVPQPQVFLIDGVETAFSSAKMRGFVEGLFRFLSSIQSNPRLSQKVTVRLFIRTDLVRVAVENVEQQIEGRDLVISWDTQSILNFALTRICDLRWFNEKFKDTVQQISAQLARLAEGAVTEPECNEFLLEIFPNKIRRNNLLTLTFLKGYFSEGLGDTASFYPRIYDTFLRSIADPAMMGTRWASIQQIEDQRVAQPLIIAAHDYASTEYLKQVAAELKNLLRLPHSIPDNQQYVDNLIEAFRGLPTPFKLDLCVEQVHRKLAESFSRLEKEVVRDSLHQMKQVGIFENRPEYAGWWRAGRLFKTALGMKYVR